MVNLDEEHAEFAKDEADGAILCDSIDDSNIPTSVDLKSILTSVEPVLEDKISGQKRALTIDEDNDDEDPPCPVCNGEHTEDMVYCGIEDLNGVGCHRWFHYGEPCCCDYIGNDFDNFPSGDWFCNNCRDVVLI